MNAKKINLNITDIGKYIANEGWKVVDNYINIMG